MIKCIRVFLFASALTAGGWTSCLQAADASPVITAPADLDKIKLFAEQIDVQADGSSTGRIHVEFQLLSNRFIDKFSKVAIQYSEPTQQLHIDQAYTLKPNGKKLPVDLRAIAAQPRKGTSPSALYSDLKEMVINFPQAGVGDTLVYSYTLRDKATFPNHFVFHVLTPTFLKIDERKIVITAPINMPITFETHGYDLKKRNDGKVITYTLHYSNEAPFIDNALSYVADDHAPRIFASSFKSYDEFAAAYAAQALTKSDVTPGIQAKANEITAGIADRREQARKIYEWIQTHIRSIGPESSRGGIFPLDAATVIANSAGVCKDQAALFAALLKAKGIESDLVIMNLGNSYVLPAVPGAGEFDHMIGWLPEFGIYADTMLHDAAFGTLAFSEYGKPVVRIGGRGPVIGRVPAVAEKDSWFASETAVKLDDAAQMNVQNTTKIRGPLVSDLRFRISQLGKGGQEKSLDASLKRNDMALSAGTINFSDAEPATPQYDVTSKYRALPNPKILSGLAFPMPNGLGPTDLADFSFLGPIAKFSDLDLDPAPCYSGHASENISLEFPATKRLAFLPDDKEIKTPNLEYTSHWSLKGNIVSVHREMRASFDQTLCTGRVRQQTVSALTLIRNDYKINILLRPTH